MIWRDFFTQTILIRGRDYYRRGKVLSLQPSGNIYHAKVLGSRPYSVRVEESEGTLYTATCDCPHSRSGYFCKHIAAVLFAIDDYEHTHSDREMAKNPFEALYNPSGESDDVYRYFDMRRMTRNLLVYEETYKRAVELLRSGTVTDVVLKYGWRDDSGGMICEADGKYKGNFDCLISATFDRNGLTGSTCEKYVSGFGITGIMKHGEKIIPNQYLLALLLEAGKRIADDPNAGDSTSSDGVKLLSSFRTERSSGTLSELRREITLEPRLTGENGRYYMTVRAGTDKLYVVKNMTEFVAAAERKGIYTSGKSSLNFARDRIREKDLPLYSFIRDVVDDAVFRAENAVSAVTCHEKRVFPAAGSIRFRVALMDYGVKRGIVRSLQDLGCEVSVWPAGTKAETVLSEEPDGIVLSNGPGDPKDNPDCICEIRKMLGVKPVFGICLGHQLTAIALGGDTAKLKYGHRGGNQPVKDVKTGRVWTTSQNHGYAVLSDSLKGIGNERFINANDGSCEGFDYPQLRCFTVQFHPEACPGPSDTGFLFDRFIEMIGA